MRIVNGIVVPKATGLDEEQAKKLAEKLRVKKEKAEQAETEQEENEE